MIKQLFVNNLTYLSVNTCIHDMFLLMCVCLMNNISVLDSSTFVSLIHMYVLDPPLELL